MNVRSGPSFYHSPLTLKLCQEKPKLVGGRVSMGLHGVILMLRGTSVNIKQVGHGSVPCGRRNSSSQSRRILSTLTQKASSPFVSTVLACSCDTGRILIPGSPCITFFCGPPHTHASPQFSSQKAHGKEGIWTVETLGLRIRGCHSPYGVYVCEGKTVKGTINNFVVTFHSFKFIMMDVR